MEWSGEQKSPLFLPNMRSGSRGFLLSHSFVESLSLSLSLSLAYSVMPWMILFENFTLVSSMWRRRFAETRLSLADDRFGGDLRGAFARFPREQKRDQFTN